MILTVSCRTYSWYQWTYSIAGELIGVVSLKTSQRQRVLARLLGLLQKAMWNLDGGPIAPSLCMSTLTPNLPQPSKPIQTPMQSIASLHLTHKSHTDSVYSMSMSSLISGITELFVTTPSPASDADPVSHIAEDLAKSHVFETLATHIRSWAMRSDGLPTAAALSSARCCRGRSLLAQQRRSRNPLITLHTTSDVARSLVPLFE